MTHALALLLFASPDAAAIAALEHVPANARTEYAGVIVKTADGYTFTIPHNTRGTDEFSLTIALPKGSRLAGIYHNHPCHRQQRKADNAKPSKADIAQAAALAVPSFIRNDCTGEIHNARATTD